MEAKKWMGSPPQDCDLCHQPICGTFVDGKTTFGPWAFMCPACHRRNGHGLGMGRGQEYQKQEDGSWLKTAG